MASKRLSLVPPIGLSRSQGPGFVWVALASFHSQRGDPVARNYCGVKESERGATTDCVGCRGSGSGISSIDFGFSSCSALHTVVDELFRQEIWQVVDAYDGG